MYIQLDSQVLYYKKRGSGKPLLLLHGNGESHKIFGALAGELEPDFTLYMPDSRGCGLSSPSGSGEYHYADMAKDMENLIDALDIGVCDVFGFSDGAITAMLLAISAPQKVNRLILCGANLTPDGLSFWAKRRIKKDFRKTKSAMTGMMLKEPHLGEADLAKIKAPALVCAGEKDIIKEAETNRIAKGIRQSELHIIKGADHGSYVIDSAYMAADVRRFLG